jgi:hypothetical protein
MVIFEGARLFGFGCVVGVGGGLTRVKPGKCTGNIHTNQCLFFLKKHMTQVLTLPERRKPLTRRHGMKAASSV